MSDIQLTSILSCPYCGGQTEETMPVDYCQVRYVCPHCQNVLRPRKGDCCVYCSYGTERCPSVQGEEG